MTIAAGTKLGTYEVLSAIGVGGMGEVYQAHDTKLGRDVAIKVLPEAFAHDPERLSRFQREAKMLAALNHSNIATIHGLEQSSGTSYLVMELVSGETLAERVKREGAVPIEEALAIAKQIAEALEAAHEKGIIHRDLKPANVKVTPEGKVKVLDFGLAKAFAGDGATEDPSNSPTLSRAATMQGVILGTAAYMSPEQAKGKAVDKRTDIWAFGCVLYELLTGKAAFHGEDITDILAAVVRAEPDWHALPEATPPPVRNLLRRCLQKDKAQRLRDAGDARIEIQEALTAPATAVAATAASATRGWRERTAWTAAAVVVFAALVLAFLYFREAPQEAPVLRTTILPPDNTTLDFTNGHGLPALSPDGKRIVFGAPSADGKTPLWVRSLDALTAQPLAGTEGAAFPFWSPDSRFIAFFADGKLKKIDASGGPALTLTDAPQGRGGSWSRDGVIIFAPTNNAGALLRVSSSGGASSPISAAQGRLPWFLPDGRHFLYQTQGGNVTINVGSLDGGENKVVTEAGSNPLYAQGYLLFLRDTTLMAQPFDAKRLVTTGEAAPVAEQVQRVLNSGTVGVFSVSETGMLAYRSGAGAGGQLLTLFDRSGKRGAAVGEPANVIVFQFSPDRKSLAAEIQEGSKESIWTYDVSRGLRTRLTFGPTTDDDPVWSPDGRSIAFRSDRKGHFDLYWQSANGAGVEELLYADNLEKIPTSWSADGKFLLYQAGGSSRTAVAGTGVDIWALPLTPQQPGGPLKPLPVLQGPFSEFDAQFSPDGKWIAYTSSESQRNEVYVTPFRPPPSEPGGKRQVSTAGGFLPRWRQDGKEIFYLGPDRRLMAAEVEAKGETIEVGQVRPLFGTIDATQGNPFYDVSADGQHFLLRTFPEEKSRDPLTLVQNWTAGLKK